MKPCSKFSPQIKINFPNTTENDKQNGKRIIKQGSHCVTKKRWETETSNKFEATESVYTLPAIQTEGFALLQRANVRRG